MIIELTEHDLDDYVVLRQKMLADAPWAFSADPKNDRASDRENLAAQIETPEFKMFGARLDGELVGSTGLMRNQNPKFRHRASIWGVYVAPHARGRGFAHDMLGTSINAAKAMGVDYLDLGVSANAPKAFAIYEQFGFRAWGREPETTEIDGVRYDEIFMTLRLRSD